jgi:hypothetical protein
MTSSVQRRLVAGIALAVIGGLLAWGLLARRPVPTPMASATPPAPATPVAATAPTRPEEPGHRAKMDAARSLRNPAQHALEFGRVLQAWIAQDPEAALAYVRRLEPGADYTQGLLMVLSAIGRSDPDRALALALEMVATREQRAFYSALFAQLVAADPAAAVARLALVPSGESRDYAVRAIADGWAQTDLPLALTWAQKLDPVDRTPAMEAVLGTLAVADPLRAIDLAQQTLAGAAFDRVLGHALQSLTRTDPKAAAALVSTLGAGQVQTEAAFSVARALAGESPLGALAWAQTLPAGDLRGKVLNNILDIWAARDPAAAALYVTQMGAGPGQESAAAYLATLLAANPTRAIAWVQSLTSEPSRHAAVVNLASAWAQQDPAAAAQWAASLAPGGVRTEALNGALSYWLLRDDAAPRNFILGLAGDTQVSAAAHLAPGLAQRDPVAALAWAQTLSSAEAREAAVIAAYARWLNNAPGDARSWLATASLPAATKARLAGP